MDPDETGKERMIMREYSLKIAETVKQFLDEDEWNYDFDEENGVFHSPSGDTAVRFMKQTDTYGIYSYADGFGAYSKRLEDSGAVMSVNYFAPYVKSKMGLALSGYDKFLLDILHHADSIVHYRFSAGGIHVIDKALVYLDDLERKL